MTVDSLDGFWLVTRHHMITIDKRQPKGLFAINKLKPIPYGKSDNWKVSVKRERVKKHKGS